MRRGVLFTIIFISCLPILSATAISPALPLIADHFGNTPSVIFWTKLLIALPGLFTAIGAPLAGWLIDAWSRKKMLHLALWVYFIGGAGSGLFFNSLWALLIGRILVGISVGTLFTVGTTLIVDYYEGHKRNQIMGLQTSFIAFTAIFSLAAGGFLADIQWRYPFALMTIAAIALPLSWFVLEDKIEKHHSHYNLPRIAWVWHNKTLPLLYIILCITLILFYMIPIEIPFILTELGVTRQSTIGIVLAIFNLTAGISALLYARVKSLFSFPSIFAFSFGAMGMGYLWIAYSRIYLIGNLAFPPILGITLGLALVGAGFGLTVPNANIWLQQDVPSTLRGRAMSGLTLFIYLGQFSSPFAAKALNTIDKHTAIIGPTFGTSSLICFLLTLFFMAFRYSPRLNGLSIQKP